MLMPHVAMRLFDTPLMIDPGKAASALLGIGGRLSDGGIVFEGADPIAHVAFENGRPSAGRIGDRLGRAYDRENASPYDRIGNVAVIGVEGTLVHKGAYVGMSSGRTSYQGLQTQIIRAARDPLIAGVVFEIDSFGGEVAGAFETAAMVSNLSAIKPTLAILTDHALSAGYLLAAPARQIIIPASGRAGSIGVIRLHADYGGALEQQGVKVTVISAGAHKADGHPYEALPDAVAKEWRADVEKRRDEFAGAVGTYRGMRHSKAMALATEAQHYDGADAVSLGLADAVGHANDAFEAFVRAMNQ